MKIKKAERKRSEKIKGSGRSENFIKKNIYKGEIDPMDSIV